MKTVEKRSGSSLIAYSAGHFLVDFACGYELWAMYVRGDLEIISVSLIFLVYNLLAFATQFALGAVSDKMKSNGALFAAAGCVLTAVGMLVGGAAPYVTVVLMGLGNSAFHVGGGTDALTRDKGMTRAGIFVSTGALGIALGCHFGEEDIIPAFMTVALLLTVAASICVYCTGERPESEEYVPADTGKFIEKKYIPAALYGVIVLFVAVFIRSYVGFVATHPASESKFAFLLPAAAAFAGKFLGGILADLIGARRTATAALVLSAPLFFLGGSRFLFFLAATFLFNIAMPVTLCEISRRLPSHEGFSFGLTALALVAGYVLALAVPLSDTVSPAASALLAVVAAVGIFLTTDDKLA